jgi:predicted SAM-dependent methyltransferase
MGKHGVAIVVGIPTFGMVSHYFSQARQSQQFPLVSSSIDYYVKGKPIADARNEIVEWAIKTDADYVYWLDDDVIAPPDSFLKLWRHQKDIINGVYWSKSNPPMPLLFRGHLEMPYLNWHVGDLIEIDAAGNGLTLVKTKVYKDIIEKVGGPCYSTEYGSFPGAQVSPLNNTEDLYFYDKARKAGYKIWADTSVQALHYEKNSDVMYGMPSSSPQANAAYTIKTPGTKLIADIGSGGVSPYMMDEGVPITFDIREEVKPDVVCDVRYLPVPNETFDIVFSSHTLEHFGWSNVHKVVEEWSRVLKVGGEMRIVVPNLRHVAQRILDDKMVPTDWWVLYGEQDYPKNYHAMGFTPSVLKAVFESTGYFDNIQVKEGDFAGPPDRAESWNLQLKATKVKSKVLDNIAPVDMEVGPPLPASYPVRIYDEWKDRPMTPEEIVADIKWLGEGLTAAQGKKEAALEAIKKYPVNQMDRTFFSPKQFEDEETKLPETTGDSSSEKAASIKPEKKKVK